MMRSLVALVTGFCWAMCASIAPAVAQAPTLVDGGWMMPVQDSAPAAQGGGSYEDMIYEVCATEGCAVSPETMIRVMYCESGGYQSAVGPNGELGIMQIDPRYHSEAYGTPYQQIEYAAQHLGVDVYWACL